MAASDHLGMQFEHSEEMHPPRHELHAYSDSGEHMGYLSWRKKGAVNPGKVLMVETEPEFRRQGVATALWNEAHSRGIKPAPVHSTEQTKSGAAWAKKVG
jgi:ribosomal protein S18 acetylase RimI-like enzyme